MPIRSTESTIAFPFPKAATKSEDPRPGALEHEVVELFDQLRDPLFRFVLSFGLPVHDGEDIIQEVFLSLFKHLRLARSRSNLRGWAFRVAHNLALKRRFANRRLQEKEDTRSDFVDAVLDPAPSAEQRMLDSEKSLRLRAVLGALPEQDQHCLRLRAEGFRYREIAEVLGMSLGAVSISLTRSLARLECADRR
jgi:RNA polymerase sigma-70 factor (ECF subfamily)